MQTKKSRVTTYIICICCGPADNNLGNRDRNKATNCVQNAKIDASLSLKSMISNDYIVGPFIVVQRLGLNMQGASGRKAEQPAPSFGQLITHTKYAGEASAPPLPRLMISNGLSDGFIFLPPDSKI